MEIDKKIAEWANIDTTVEYKEKPRRNAYGDMMSGGIRTRNMYPKELARHLKKPVSTVAMMEALYRDEGEFFFSPVFKNDNDEIPALFIYPPGDGIEEGIEMGRGETIAEAVYEAVKKYLGGE
jgi:hypothetical protein